LVRTIAARCPAVGDADRTCGDVEPNGCDQDHVKPMLQGASNLWFPVLISAAVRASGVRRPGRSVEDNWVVLDK
jgi:hypothetical protein